MKGFLQWHFEVWFSTRYTAHCAEYVIDIQIWNACFKKSQCHGEARNTALKVDNWNQQAHLRKKLLNSPLQAARDGECASKIMELASCGGTKVMKSWLRHQKISPVSDVLSDALKWCKMKLCTYQRSTAASRVHVWIPELNLHKNDVNKAGRVHVVPFNFYLIYQGMDEWIEKVEDWVAELIFVDELVESIESSHVVHYGWWKNPGTYQPNMYQKPWK